MKLHLPVRLFKSVLTCMAAITALTMGSGTTWADAQNLTFSGSSLTWDTDASNQVYTDEENAAAAFSPGDDVSFTSACTVTLEEDIKAGIVAVEVGADVTLKSASHELDFETLKLAGTLNAGDSLYIGAGDTLEIAASGAVLESDLVLGERGSLILNAAVDLNNNSLQFGGSTGLILTSSGDGRVYDLFTDIGSLLDAEGNALSLTSSNNDISLYFDESLPGSGFWANSTLQMTTDGTLQLVRYTDITLPSGYGTTVTVDDVADITPYSSSASDVIFRVDSGNLTNNSLTISNQSSALMTASSRAWYFTSDSLSSLSNLKFSSARTTLFTLASAKTLTFDALKTLTFSSNRAGSYGGCIYFPYSSGAVYMKNIGRINFSSNYINSGSAKGAAMLIFNGYIVDNAFLTFSGNYANGSSASSGGAICINENGQLEVANNIKVLFNKNWAMYRGGAICSFSDSKLKLKNNVEVVFAGNYAKKAGAPCGGAIHSLGDVSFIYNGNIEFTNNYATVSTTYDTHYSDGGAIYGNTIQFDGNDKVLFKENYVSATVTNYCASAFGGALYGGDIRIIKNNDVLFFENYSTGNKSYSLSLYGGAIYAGNLIIDNNNSVKFIKNRVATEASSGVLYGGAIYVNGVITISNNGYVEFSDNSVGGGSSSVGGAIYSAGGAVDICSNEELLFKNNVGMAISSSSWGSTVVKIAENSNVVFENNSYQSDCGAIHAESIIIADNDYALFEKNYCGSSPSLVSLKATSIYLSAPDKGLLEFRDSIKGSGNWYINDLYIDTEGVEKPQLGDVVLTGGYVQGPNGHLLEISGGVVEDESQITNSLASTALTVHVYDGKFSVIDGAILSCQGVEVHNSYLCTPTMALKDSSVHSAGYDIIFQPYAVFELTGVSFVKVNNLNMKRNSCLTFYVTKNQIQSSNLTLEGDFVFGNNLTINISFTDSLADSGWYKLMSVTSITDSSLWTSENVTVNGLDGFNVSFNDLKWEDNTLYLNYSGIPGTGGEGGSGTAPALRVATWTNEAGDGLWNGTSLNWVQGEVDYTYVDDVQVVFGDEGAGTVTLVGNLAPESVLVENSSGNDYTWNADATEGGKLTGDMTLTKKGAGKLTINTANDYTGGTSILGGTVEAGSATALGSGTVSLSNATLQIAAGNFTNNLTTAGTSRIDVLNGASLNPGAVIENSVSGTLSLSGKVDVSGLGALEEHAATRVDVNGNEGASGFARAAGYSLQVVKGGRVLGSGAELVHSGLPTGMNLVLREDGLAVAGGAEDYALYLITGNHSVSVRDILGAVPAGESLSSIRMDSGMLQVNTSTDILTASGGTITLTDAARLGGEISGGMVMAQRGELAAELSGSASVIVTGEVTLSGNNSHSGGVTLNGGNLVLNHASALGSGTVVTNGNSRLSVSSGVELNLKQAVTNTGTLTLSGSFCADALAATGTIAATRVDLAGNKGASGFYRGEGFTLQVVSGGTVNDDAAVIRYNGQQITLDDRGMAEIAGGILYNQYHIAAGHTAGVRAIAEKSAEMGSTLGHISLAAGGTLNADATADVHATGGTINLTAGTISGTLANVSMTAAGGEIAANFRGTSVLIGSDHELASVLRNSGYLILTGSYQADALSRVLTGVDVRIDADGNEGGASGFLRTGDFTVTVASGTVNSADAIVSYRGQQLEMSGGVGFGLGTVDYTNYLLTDGDRESVSDIREASGNLLEDITLEDGHLTVDESAEVNATGGSITITDDSMLFGTISGTDMTAAEGNYNSTISASIGGDSTLSILGGTIDLTGNNSYTGGTTINGGTLEVGHASALGKGEVALEDGTLDLNKLPVKNDITATGGTLSGAENYDGKLTVDGDLTLGGETTAGGGIELNGGSISGGSIADTDILVDGEGDMEISSAIRGNGSLTLTDGDLTLSGNNSYTGGTVINGGSLITGSSSALGSGDVALNDGELDLNKMPVKNDITATGGTLSGAENYEGKLTVDGDLTLGGETTAGGGVELNGGSISGGSIVDTDILVDGEGDMEISSVISGNGSLTLTEGDLTLSGNNSYTGGTVINGGSLTAGSSTALGSGDVALNDGELDLNRQPVKNDITATGGTLSGAENYDGKLTVDGDLTLGGETTAGGGIELNGGSISGGVIVDTDILVDGEGDMEISSAISGDSSLTINGGDVTLSGENDYTGGTIVNGGNLQAGVDSAFGEGSITVNNGTLDLNDKNVGNDIIINNGSLTGNDNYNGNLSIGGDNVTVEGGYTLGAGKVLEVAVGGTEFGSDLTLAGGTLLFKGAPLTVDGAVSFTDDTTTLVDLRQWAGELTDGLTLAVLGADVTGWQEGCLELIGMSGMSLGFNDATGAITLQIAGQQQVSETITWLGAKKTVWQQGKAGWMNATTGYDAVFEKGADVIFTQPGKVTIVGAVEPGSVIVAGDKAITFKADKYNPGRIVGDTSLTKRGNGKLTLNDGNTYSGGTFIEAGTVTAGGARSFGTGDITISGGILDLKSKAVDNDISLVGAATIKAGKKYQGSLYMEGDLLKGSVLNIAESATLAGGTLNGTLSGTGTVAVTGDVALGTSGKITTNALNVSGNLTVSTKGLSMNTKTSAITVTSGGHIQSEGSMKAYSMNLAGGSVELKGAKAASMTLTNTLNMSNHAKFTLSGKLTAGQITLTDSTLNLTSSKLQTVTAKNTLTLNGDNTVVFDFDAKDGKTYKLFSFKSFTNSGSDLYSLLGWEQNDSIYELAETAKNITLTVYDSEGWETYMDSLAGEAQAADASDVDRADAAVGEPIVVQDVDPVMAGVADTLVQTTWGTAGASRAFSDTIANRGAYSTTLAEGKGAAWISTMGGSSRISSDAGHAGADYTLTGAAFGIEGRVADKSVIGLAIGNSWGKVSTFSAYPVDQDSTHMGIYGNHALGTNTTLSWAATHTRTESDGTLAGLPAEWTQDALQLDARLTRHKQLSHKTTASAFVGLQYLATDSGEYAGIRTGSLQNLRAEIGVGATHRVSPATLVYGELSFVGDMVRNNPTADPGGYRAHGANPGRAGINLGVGATHQLTEDWSLNASYNFELMQNVTSHSLNLGASYSF